MLPHDEDCIKIYSNAIFSEHYWDLWWADPFLIMLTKGSVFLFVEYTYGAFTTFLALYKGQKNMKNIFELLANNLFLRREPKRNLRCDLDFRKARKDIQEDVGCELQKNESYLSLLIDRCEIFLGEVNYDISSIPMGKFHVFEQYFTYRVTVHLREFIKNGDKELVEKLHDHMKDDEYALRYIVKECINGTCMSFTCKLQWDCNDTIDDIIFKLSQFYCDWSSFGTCWLDYWYDRKSYFAC